MKKKRQGIPPFKFEQIRDMLINEIETGIFSPGYQLPAISQLCDEHGISRVTVSRAFMHLKKRGYIFYLPGKGHYVS